MQQQQQRQWHFCMSSVDNTCITKTSTISLGLHLSLQLIPHFFFFFVPMKCHLHLNSSQKKNWSDPSTARHVFWCTPVANSNHPTASQERDPLRQWMKQRSVEEVEKGCIIISLKITRAVTRAAVNEKGAVGVRVLKEISRSRPQTFYFLSILYIVFIV